MRLFGVAVLAVVTVLGVSSACVPPGEGEGEGEGASFAAPHDAAPQVVDFGGPVLTAPVVVPVVFAGDAQKPVVDELLPALQSSGWWTAATSEYGVGNLTVADDVVLDGPPPARVDSATLLSQLEASGAALDAQAMVLFVIPQETVFSDDGDCCVDFDGYHEADDLGGATVGVAYACACPGSDGPQFDALDELSLAITHELVETATDPFGNPAWGGVDDDHVAWEIETEGEIADMCEFLDSLAADVPGVPLPVQRSWSNKAAAQDHDPCIPAPDGEVYFNSVPVLPDTADVIDAYGDAVRTPAKLIAVGATATVDVELWSEGPTSGPWSVVAFDGSELNGGDALLAFDWDRTTGENGDVLHLSITVNGVDPTIGGEVFLVQSALGDQTSMAIGMVSQ